MVAGHASAGCAPSSPRRISPRRRRSPPGRGPRPHGGPLGCRRLVRAPAMRRRIQRRHRSADRGWTGIAMVLVEPGVISTSLSVSSSRSAAMIASRRLPHRSSWASGLRNGSAGRCRGFMYSFRSSNSTQRASGLKTAIATLLVTASRNLTKWAGGRVGRAFDLWFGLLRAWADDSTRDLHRPSCSATSHAKSVPRRCGRVRRRTADESGPGSG